MNNLDLEIARTQKWLSVLYLTATFAVILIYELGGARLSTAGQEKTFDSMVSWMTGGALIVLYFWLQRARAAGIPDPSTTTTITQQTTTPTGDPHAPPTIHPLAAEPPASGQLRDPNPRPTDTGR